MSDGRDKNKVFVKCRFKMHCYLKKCFIQVKTYGKSKSIEYLPYW